MSADAVHAVASEGGDSIEDSSALAARKVLRQDRRRLVAESLGIGNPLNNTRLLPDQAMADRDGPLEVDVESIRPYERNPRRDGNGRFAEIKESIRVSGMRVPLTVTRRPGEAHYIVETGGNTRLLALQQLWAETGDSRFRTLTVLFRPWRSETHVLTAHMIENEQRGDMSYRDRAAAIVALRAQMESERCAPLSLRGFEEALAQLGLALSTATLSQCLFAGTRLRTLCEAVPDLSGMDVKAIQPKLNLMKRYAQLRCGIAEEALYDDVFEPVFRDMEGLAGTEGFSVSRLFEACVRALSRHFREAEETVRRALERLSRMPMATLEELHAALEPVRERSPDSDPGFQAEAMGLERCTERLQGAVRHYALCAGVPEASFGDLGDLGTRDASSVSRSDVPEEERPRIRSKGRELLAYLFAPPTHSDELPGEIGESDGPFLDWLLDPGDKDAAALWEALAAFRELRRELQRKADAPC